MIFIFSGKSDTISETVKVHIEYCLRRHDNSTLRKAYDQFKVLRDCFSVKKIELL